MHRRLSKSQYVKGRRCPKRLWLYNHHRELATPPSPFQKGILEQGQEVGELARERFPGGELIDEDHTAPEEALAHTRRAIESGQTTLYEAAFVFENVLVRADILVKNAEDTWDLYEVKSGTNRDEPKKEYLLDLAVQKYVLQGAALPVGKTHLVRLNRHYRRKGKLDLTQLFDVKEMDVQIRRELQLVPAYLKELQEILGGNEPPASNIGSVCKNPYVCEFKAHCWKDLPENSIHYLTHIRDSLRHDLLHQDIHTIAEIPEDMLTDARQIRQWECEVHEKEAEPDIENIAQHLFQLHYPIYFLDFETSGYAIPAFESTRPYQKLPFQFSLHVQPSPFAHCEHHEFLCDERKDPRLDAIRALLSRIGKTGSVVVYHASFEGPVLRELAKDFPEHADGLFSIASRLWDLEHPFAQRWICRAEFRGKSSIKYVLPGMIPGFSYKDLEIKSGDLAMQAYQDLISEKTTPTEKARLRAALLAYCERDSHAMVRILECLQTLYPNRPSEEVTESKRVHRKKPAKRK